MKHDRPSLCRPREGRTPELSCTSSAAICPWPASKNTTKYLVNLFFVSSVICGVPAGIPRKSEAISVRIQVGRYWVSDRLPIQFSVALAKKVQVNSSMPFDQEADWGRSTPSKSDRSTIVPLLVSLRKPQGREDLISETGGLATR
jgi:hypothetical protein